MNIAEPTNRRILVIDDNPSIHDDFRKILGPIDARLADELDADEAALFGDAPEAAHMLSFEIDSAFQGEEGLEKVRAAVAAGAPHAVAFVDVRMPPGWDGIETITRIWAEFPGLEVVICTAYSDHSWDEIAKAVGHTDHVLVLKKPFDTIEVMQMAHTLSRKWQRAQTTDRQMAELGALVSQRTAELRAATTQLTGEVAGRTAAEVALRRSEGELRQAQKMEAMGRLATGVAHDFNNMLTVILGYASLLQMEAAQPDEKLTASLRQVELAAERATALTRQLLTFSRKQAIQRCPLQLNGIVEQTVGLLRRVIGEHIALEMQLAPELPLVVADAGSIDQVVMNLAINARDAMPDGGQLTLSTTAIESDGDTARHPDARRGRFVCLAVRDTGCGMDAATVARIFEPFFTTKEPGKGTGMGLSTVHGVLQQHGGWIEVESSPGRGTVIRALFPLAEEDAAAAPAAPAAAPAVTAPTAGRTILVVEDEDLLREFVTAALAGLGYRVLAAANGRVALEIWAAHRDEIDLLLTDIVMPESISGRQLAHELVTQRPDLKVIFTSGYNPEQIGADFEQQTEHTFLAKPYLTDQLAEAVALRLSSQRAATAR